MDERTKKKHLDAIRYGLRYFEGHIAHAVQNGISPAAIMGSMISAASALGALAIEREAFAAGVNKRDSLPATPAKPAYAIEDKAENINCEFEPQLASGWDFPNIGRGIAKEAA